MATCFNVVGLGLCRMRRKTMRAAGQSEVRTSSSIMILDGADHYREELVTPRVGRGLHMH